MPVIHKKHVTHLLGDSSLAGKQVRFITGSSYSGQWSKKFNCMHGYGVYNFPNGAVYRGFFRRGHFHGFGRITLSSPYTLVLQGSFENGVMKVVDECAHFNDGLQIQAKIELAELPLKTTDLTVFEDKIDMSGWKYLKHAYKQECLDILQRNKENNVSTLKHPKVCKKGLSEDFKVYMPNVCGTTNAENDIPACSSADTMRESFGGDFIPDKSLHYFSQQLDVSEISLGSESIDFNYQCSNACEEEEDILMYLESFSDKK